MSGARVTWPANRWLVVSLVGIACGRGDAPPRRVAAAPADARPATPDASATRAVVEAPVAVAAPAGPYQGPDCRTAYAPRPDRDDAAMCFQPGGGFLMGSPEGEGGPAEHPQRRVTLSPFFIDQFEVTRAQFARFLNEAPHGLRCDEILPHMCPGKRVVRTPWALDLIQGAKVVEWDGTPFTNEKISFVARQGEERFAFEEIPVIAAHSYCRWAGKALPTNAQWEYAARVEPLTGKLRRYPWGDRFRKGIANCDAEVCGVGGGGTAAAVDSFPRDVSATGVRGLAGNVTEWVSECATPTIPDCGACIDPIGPSTCESQRSEPQGEPSHPDGNESGPALRGGSSFSWPDHVRGAWRSEEGRNGAWSAGFRCVANSITAPPTGSGPAR